MHKLNVCGLSCPLPVLRVKEAIDKGELPLQVTCDVGAPRENITRLAESKGLAVKEEPAASGSFSLELRKK